VLHGDAAAERRDAIDRLIGDRFGVIEEPVKAFDGHVLVDFSRTRRAPVKWFRHR